MRYLPSSCARIAAKKPALAKAEHAGPLDLGIFQFSRHRHGIFDHANQPVKRKIGPARVADQNGRPAARKRGEPFCRRAREVLFVGDIAREHDVPALVGADQVFETRRDQDAILGGVRLDRGDGEGVDVGGLDLSRAGLGRRDRDQPRAGCEIQRALAGDKSRMVERVARQRLAACPGKRPEWRRQPDRAEFLLRLLPDRDGFIRESQPDLGRQRRRDEAGIGQDEVALSVHGRFDRHRIDRSWIVQLEARLGPLGRQIQPSSELRPNKIK
jgi:hypothetical protein